MVSPMFPQKSYGEKWEKVHGSSANATAWNVLQRHVGNLSVLGKTMENLNDFFYQRCFFSVRNLQNLGLLGFTSWAVLMFTTWLPAHHVLVAGTEGTFALILGLPCPDIYRLITCDHPGKSSNHHKLHVEDCNVHDSNFFMMIAWVFG